MPLLAAEQPLAREVAEQLRRLADLVERIGTISTGQGHPELRRVGALLARAATQLEGAETKSVSARQIASIASSFEGVGDALRRAIAPRKRRATTKRATARRSTAGRSTTRRTTAKRSTRKRSR